jgi:hypothetical protein
MALVATFDLAENMITSVLSQVRRGVSLSRMDNTADSTTGVMVDLPDKVDFEINLLRHHQTLSRITQTTESSNSLDLESSLDWQKDSSKTTDVEITGSVNVDLSSLRDNGTDSTQELAGQVSGIINRINSAESDGSASLSGESDRSGSLEFSGGAVISAGGSSSLVRANGGSLGNTSETDLRLTSRSSNESSKEDSSSTDKSTDNKTETDVRLDGECSDKFVKSDTKRNYWKLDEDTGGVTQAS